MPVDDKGQEYDESWDLATGLLDDFDGAIVSSEFGTKADYADSDGNLQTLFIARILPRDASEPFDGIFSVGRGWEIVEGGRAAARSDGKRKFMQSSMYGLLLGRARGLYPDIIKRGPTDRIGIFNGTDWHWKREKIEYGGRLEAKEHLMPSKFLGVVKIEGVAAGGGAGGGADDVAEDLNLLALQHETHKAFLQAFLADKSLQDRTKAAKLTAKVLNQKADGFWMSARREAGMEVA